MHPTPLPGRISEGGTRTPPAQTGSATVNALPTTSWVAGYSKERRGHGSSGGWGGLRVDWERDGPGHVRARPMHRRAELPVHRRYRVPRPSLRRRWSSRVGRRLEHLTRSCASDGPAGVPASMSPGEPYPQPYPEMSSFQPISGNPTPLEQAKSAPRPTDFGNS